MVKPRQAASSEQGTAGSGQRRPRTDRLVFGIAALVALAFVLWGVVDSGSLGRSSAAALEWVASNGGWAFVAAASGFVIFVLWLALSRYGRIPLGRDEEEPEFRTSSWIAMMFSAGMGIGLIFFGVAEPLAHFADPPPGTSPQAPAYQVQDTAMATTLFHWTLHPWSMYAVAGLTIAYSTFRRGRSQLLSSAFIPLLGEKRAKSAFGRAIDILAIFATLFGSAASLGLGTLQISRGLQAVGWMDEPGTPVLIAVIAFLTLAFVASAVSGIARGIQWLSNINMVLAMVLATFIFVVGPTVLILSLLPTSVGTYVDELAIMAARTGAQGAATEQWLATWTVFYWAWWISWTPFVGTFIARISRGRTIREFVAGVILVPSSVTLVWFAIFGGSAIDAQRGGTDLAGASTQEAQLFGLLDLYPLATITSVLVMILIAIFFVSGADAASIVMGTLSQQGSIHPSKQVVTFWGVLMGAVAAIMLVVGAGGSSALEGLQNLTILVAAPFGIVMIAMCWSLLRDLRSDRLMRRETKATEVVEEAVTMGTKEYAGDFRLEIGPIEPLPPDQFPRQPEGEPEQEPRDRQP